MRCLKLAWAGVAGMGEDLAVLFVPHYARRAREDACSVKLDVGCGSEKRRAIASL
jgi:hypothetical protein